MLESGYRGMTRHSYPKNGTAINIRKLVRHRPHLKSGEVLRGIAVVHIHYNHSSKRCPKIFVDVRAHELNGSEQLLQSVWRRDTIAGVRGSWGWWGK